MRGLEGSYLGGRPLVHGEATAGPCPLVRLRHLAEQRHQRHHLGTFLETGCHRLVWFTSWSELGTRSWWPPPATGPLGWGFHTCVRANELSSRRLTLTRAAWGFSEAGRYPHLERTKARSGRVFPRGLTGTCSQTRDGHPRLGGCTGPSKTGARGLGFSGILTTSSHVQLGSGAQLPPHPL